MPYVEKISERAQKWKETRSRGPHDRVPEDIEREILNRFYSIAKASISVKQLAELYGVTPRTVNRIIESDQGLDILEKQEKMASVLKRAAQAKLDIGSYDAARLMVEDAMKEREDKYQYLSQNARRDVMDRAGLRAVKEDKQDINITLSSGVELGMPGRAETTVETVDRRTAKEALEGDEDD